MTEQVECGEILRVHSGAYRTFVYPPQALTPEQADQCLQHTQPRDLEQGNQIWRCGDFRGQILLVSAYSAFYTNHLQADYCHAVYRRLSISTLHEHVKDTILYPFASEEDVLNLKHQPDFAEEWRCREAATGKQAGILTLSPEYLAELACYGLYCGLTQNLGQLVILIPESEEYMLCCRMVMVRILLCIPAGLRRHLSFATYAGAMAAGKFAVLFARHDASLLPSQTVVPLDGVAHWPIERLRDTALPLPLVDLIREAAKDSLILDEVYTKIEEGRTLDSLTQESYEDFWFPYTLKTKKMDYVLLQKYSAWLTQSALPQQKRDVIANELGARLNKENLADILRQDKDLTCPRTLENLAKALEKYQAVLNLLNRKLDIVLSSELLKNCKQQIPKNQSIKKWLKVKSDLERCQATQLLDPQIVNANFGEIEQGIKTTKMCRQTYFLTTLPYMLANRQYDQIQTKLEDLRECGEDVRSTCLLALSRKTVDYINSIPLEDSESQSVFEVIYSLLEDDSQKKPLDDWHEEWKRQKERKQKNLLSMTSFRAYFASGVSGREYEDRLWENLENIGRKKCGLIDLIQAMEQVKKVSWSELVTPLSDLLPVFIRNYQMGIWLDSEKQWGPLYSELLAYQRLTAKTDACSDIYLWSVDTGSFKTFKAKEVLETIDYILTALAERPEHGKYSSEVFQYFLSAGMLSIEQSSRIRPYLRLADAAPLAEQNCAGVLTESSQNQGGWQRRKDLLRNFWRVFFRLIKIAAVAALAGAVLILLMLFSGGRRESGVPAGGGGNPSAYSTGDTAIP